MTRTTVRVDEHLLRQVKELAAKSGRTFTDIIDDALRQMVLRSVSAARRPAVRLPTFKGNGLQPGVDLSDNASVLDAMDKDLPLEKRR